MTKTQLQQSDLNQIQAIGEFGVPELLAMKESIAKKLSIPQFNLFMYQMNRMGLDPNLGHGVPILYGQDLNIRIEYEGWKSLAQDSEGYKGIFSQAIREEDDFSAESDEDGVITKINYKMGKPPRGKVVGSYAVAKREGHKDVIIVCDVDEFEKYVKKNASFWKLENGNIDPDMAKKFAATRAVKAQFNIAQVVDDNMMALGVSENNPIDPPQRRDITEEANQMSANQQKAEASANSPTTTTPPSAAVDDTSKLQKIVISKFRELEITTSEGREEFYSFNNIKFKDFSNPTIAEMTGLIKVLDLKIEEKNASTPGNDELDEELKDLLT